MRMSNRITFVYETGGGYDPDEGEHKDPETEEETRPCNLSELGIERTSEVFGEYDKEIIVARTQMPFKGEISHVKLNDNDDKYRIERQSNYRKGVYFLERMKNG